MIVLLFEGAHLSHHLRDLSFVVPVTVLKRITVIFIGSPKCDLVSSTVELIVFYLHQLIRLKSILKHQVNGLLLGFD